MLPGCVSIRAAASCAEVEGEVSMRGWAKLCAALWRLCGGETGRVGGRLGAERLLPTTTPSAFPFWQRGSCFPSPSSVWSCMSFLIKSAPGTPWCCHISVFSRSSAPLQRSWSPRDHGCHLFALVPAVEQGGRAEMGLWKAWLHLKGDSSKRSHFRPLAPEELLIVSLGAVVLRSSERRHLAAFRGERWQLVVPGLKLQSSLLKAEEEYLPPVFNT